MSHKGKGSNGNGYEYRKPGKKSAALGRNKLSVGKSGRDAVLYTVFQTFDMPFQ